MKFHRYSEIFPLIEGQAFDDLVLDIKMNGQKEKIWLYEGKILDGRNRYLACQRAKVKPQTKTYHGKEPLKFVLSLNMHRRHLNESQRAMVAARLTQIEAEDRKAGAPIGAGALSQSDAATTMNVGRRSVQRAAQVQEKGSKQLQDAVDAGELSVSKAAAVLDRPKGQQLAAAKEPTPAPEAPNLNEGWVPEHDEDAYLAGLEKEYAASIDRIMGADDKLKAAHEELKRQAAQIAQLKLSRDGFQNERLEAIRLVKQLRRENDGLKRKLDKAA